MSISGRGFSGRSRLGPALGVTVLLTFAASAAVPALVAATTTFTVNRIGDAADINITNAKCDTSTASGNQCTLRAAIQEANDTPGVDTINFNITSSSKTITPGTPLPTITEVATINGYSQSGATANTLAVGNNAVIKIVLDGVNAGAGADGLAISGDNVVIKGLVIQRFKGSGVHILAGADKNRVVGNFIGTNAAGSLARANGVGITVEGGQGNIGSGTPAERNVISGNTTDGVLLTGAASCCNNIAGNYIGTRKGGGVALPNGGNGVNLQNANSANIGLPGDGAGNLISGNTGHGILVFKDSGASNVVIRHNLIGTDSSGTAALGNGMAGIYADALSVVIGGTGPTDFNVISANGDAGIWLEDSDSTEIKRNRIGTKADGTGDLGNEDGIKLEGTADDTIIGGSSADGNVIAGSDFDGILILGGIHNTIEGNAIRNNTFHGILVGESVQAIRGNAIFANGDDGIQVGGSVSGVRIAANQIYANGALGIDLAGGTEDSFKTTANDANDPDPGPNTLQNYPVLTAAVRTPSGLTTVTGTLDGTASTTFTIELFIALVDASGHGEGQILIATMDVTTIANGDDVNFTFSAIPNLSTSTRLTATATAKNAGNTSEFSLNRQVTQPST